VGGYWERDGRIRFPDQRNAGDCERKCTNLKRSYITIENNCKTCANFKEMSNRFQQGASIQPVTLCSSRAGTNIVPESKSNKDYARQRSNRCSVHFKEVTRGVLRQGEEVYMCFVDLEKAFDRVRRRLLEWAMRKRGIREAMVRAVMSLY